MSVRWFLSIGYFLWNLFLSNYSSGNALAKAGGKKLRDIVSQAVAGANLNNAGDGELFSTIKIKKTWRKTLLFSVAISEAGDLAASYLIHVNSPTWNAANSADCIAELDKATMNILTLADNKGLKSVALPSISSGQWVLFEYRLIEMSFGFALLALDFRNKRQRKQFSPLYQNFSDKRRQQIYNRSFSFSTIRKVLTFTQRNFNGWLNKTSIRITNSNFSYRRFSAFTVIRCFHLVRRIFCSVFSFVKFD